MSQFCRSKRLQLSGSMEKKICSHIKQAEKLFVDDEIVVERFGGKLCDTIESKKS